MKKLILNIILLVMCSCMSYSQRQVSDLSNDWIFSFPGGETEDINLPHTFNHSDPFDDQPGYYRGKVNYTKILYTTNWEKTHKHYIRFYAVNQEASVFLNGKLVGEHKGGYTAFVVELTKHLTFESDSLSVIVDNSHNDAIVPLKGDFNFYGGIYRGVEHISVPYTHFSVDIYGADGLFIDPVAISDSVAKVRLWVHLEEFDSSVQKINLELINPGYKNNGRTIYSAFEYDKNSDRWFEDLEIENPRLWSITDPFLYNFIVWVGNSSDSSKIYDRLQLNYGLRYFHFDLDNGFFLNGQHEKLIGVNRHQDRPGIGNALSVDHHIQDMDIIRNMGANFLRTAHYPQDVSITDYCDRNGILVSMEIPLDHEISDHPEFNDNCKTMMLEMIHQYYNHPSVIIWAYMNEMGLWKDAKRDSLHMTKVADLARELEDLTRKADPYRYTMIPHHGFFDIYQEFGLNDISMIVGWNLYHGWYVPDVNTFGDFIDRAHRLVPDKPIIITEYGAGADPRITSFKPKRFDFSVNWELEFHRAHLKQILDRDFIAGSAVWNMFDFGSETRNDAVPNVNNKGLCGFDRQPKAPYYLYQEHLRKDLEVLVPNPEPKFIMVDKYQQDIPAGFSGNVWTIEDLFEQQSVLSINFGTDYYFEHEGFTWIPAASIPENTLTIQGGERAIVRDIGFGTDKAISKTELDPVYQTWYENPTSLALHLPEGMYRLVFHFSNNHPENADSFFINVNSEGESYSLNELSDFKKYQAYTYETKAMFEETINILFSSPTSGGHTYINGLQIISL